MNVSRVKMIRAYFMYESGLNCNFLTFPVPDFLLGMSHKSKIMIDKTLTISALSYDGIYSLVPNLGP